MNHTPVSGHPQTPKITDDMARLIYHLHRELGLTVGEAFPITHLYTALDPATAHLIASDFFSAGYFGIQLRPNGQSKYFLTQSALAAYNAWAATPRLIRSTPATLVVSDAAEAVSILRDIQKMCALHLQSPCRRRTISHRHFIAELQDMLSQILNRQP